MPLERMTVIEAITALDQFNIGLRRWGSLQYQLFYREDTTFKEARTIDELEECVEVARQMRMERNEKQAGDNTFISLVSVS